MERTNFTSMLKSCLALALLIACCYQAQATHFRYGHLTWQPKPAVSATTAEFTLIAAFRYTGYFGSGPGGTILVGDTFTEDIGLTGINFGDGNSTGTLQFVVTSIDPINNWLLAQALEPGNLAKNNHRPHLCFAR